jgi:hypothetical protein
MPQPGPTVGNWPSPAGIPGLDVSPSGVVRGMITGSGLGGRGARCRRDLMGYSNDSAMAITVLAKHGMADRSTWSSTRARTLRR